MINVSEKIVLYLILIFLCGVSITACIFWQGNQEPKSSLVSDGLNKVTPIDEELDPMTDEITESMQDDQTIEMDKTTLISMASGKFVITPGDVIVFIQENTFDMVSSLRITPSSTTGLSNIDETGWNRPLIVNVELLDKSGKNIENPDIASPLLICFNLEDSILDEYKKDESSLEIQRFDLEEDPPVWTTLPIAKYTEWNLLCGVTQHLSLFSAAIKVPQELTETIEPMDLYSPNP